MALKKKAKKKKAAVEMTLWDVVLSYPDLHDPKPYKGKTYYRTDVLMDWNEDSKDPQVAAVRKAIKQVKTDTWGDDESEWPETEKPLVQNGDEREDQQGYAGKRYITASTQTPVPVVDPKGKAFNPQMVKGGMFANVAIRISAWEFDGDEGVSIYLQGVQIDTSKPGLNFGGGKSVKQMFSKGDDDEDQEENDDADSDGADSSDDEEDDKPRKSKAKKKASRDDEDDEEEKPRAKKKPSRNFDEDDEE